MELRGERARSLGHAVRLLTRGVVTSGDGEELMHHLLRVFRAQSIAIAQDFRFDGWNLATNIPATWFALHTRYRHQDPFIPQLATGPRGETYCIDRDASSTQKECDLFYHLRDQGYGDGMIASMYNPFLSDLAIVFYRTKNQAFSDEDEDVFRLLYPHLAGGLAARRALAALRQHDVPIPLRGYVELSLPAGTFTWSPDARTHWREQLGIDGDAGWRRAEQLLLASARGFHAPDGGQSQRVMPGLRVEWARVPPARDERMRLIGLMVLDGEPTTSLSPAAQLLTKRQRAIALAAATGSTAREIAAQLGIQPETVRWTLREVYRRLGVRSRAALATLLQTEA